MSTPQSLTESDDERPADHGGQLRTILFFMFLPGWTVFWGSLAILAGWIRNRWLFRLSIGTWSRGILAVSGIRVKIIRSPSLANRPCVFVVNHQSAIDIPVLVVATLLSHDVRFMAKESLFKIPFLGWGISGNGFIPIRRDNPRHAADTIKRIVERNGPLCSYAVFPEGTRSPDGRLQEFRRGSIAMTLRLERPLVPVSIIDACRANPKGRLLLRSGTVRVVFHDPIAVSESAAEDRTARDEMTGRLHEQVNSALPEEQRAESVPPAVC